MKISKRHLKRIIREEKQKLQEMEQSRMYIEKAEIEDALIECFCDWTSDGATATMSFNEFMLEVAKKLNESPQALAQSCELIHTGAI